MTPAFAWMLTAGLLALGITLALNMFRLDQLGNERAGNWCMVGSIVATALAVSILTNYLNTAEPWGP